MIDQYLSLAPYQVTIDTKRKVTLVGVDKPLFNNFYVK